MADFEIKSGDTLPVIRSLLKDATNTPVPLPVGTTVRFHMRPAAGGASTVDAPATIFDAVTAEVRYAWQAGDTDADGDFLAEWEVTYSDGTVLTVPNTSDITIQIHPQVA